MERGVCDGRGEVFDQESSKDAPILVVILLDDLGFGGISATGSLLQPSHLDKLASNGLLSMRIDFQASSSAQD